MIEVGQRIDFLTQDWAPQWFKRRSWVVKSVTDNIVILYHENTWEGDYITVEWDTDNNRLEVISHLIEE